MSLQGPCLNCSPTGVLPQLLLAYQECGCDAAMDEDDGEVFTPTSLKELTKNRWCVPVTTSSAPLGILFAP